MDKIVVHSTLGLLRALESGSVDFDNFLNRLYLLGTKRHEHDYRRVYDYASKNGTNGLKDILTYL